MDPVLFPRTTRYLASLPNGLLSHPECQGKASLYREALKNCPRPVDTQGLHSLLTDYIVEPVPVTSWIPEVVSNALYLVIADQVFKNDEAFLDWISDFSRKVFEAPMYRVLMAVASPERLANGGQRRWANFHTGIDYDLVIGPNGTEATMKFPTNLFDKLVFRAHLRAIEAAYRASGAKNAVMELDSLGANEARFRAVWYPERLVTR